MEVAGSRECNFLTKFEAIFKKLMGVVISLKPALFGDEEEFKLVFRQHYQSLCQSAYHFLNDLDMAEEIVQNTWVKLWEKRNEITIDGTLKSYVYKMVYNASMNEIKRNKIKQTMAQMNPMNESNVYQTNIKELEIQIEKALNKLPEQCRLIFKMSRFQDLKYREIADVLNISIKTVENQMGKALKLMRENLTEYLTVITAFLSFIFNPFK